MNRLAGLFAPMTAALLASACFPAPELAERDGEGPASDAVDPGDAAAEEDGQGGDPDLTPSDVTGDADASTDTEGPGEDSGGTSPEGDLVATGTDEGVALSWSAEASAAGYRIERCATAPLTEAACDGLWQVLGAVEASVTTWLDVTAELAPPPAAPEGLVATQDDPAMVKVSWSPVVPPPSPRYAYRVISTRADAADLAATGLAVGARPTPAVSAYAISPDGGATWRTLPSDATTVSLPDAPAPAVEVSLRASEGDDPAAVRVEFATDVVRLAGAPIEVLVSARTALSEGPQGTVTGRRGVPTELTVRWERSSGGQDADHAPLSGEVSTRGVAGDGWTDPDAPADGGARYYRAVLSGPGLAPWTTPSVAGWRKPPNLVVPAVRASDDLPDLVKVTWEAVAGASSYDVYKNGTRQATVTGLAWEDLSAAAPTAPWGSPVNLTVTGTPDKVALAWTAPVRPVGPSASYTVTVANSAVQSAADSGQRAAPALVGWDVEVERGGELKSWALGDLAPSWVDPDAPAASFGVGSVQAGTGLRRASVALSAVLVGAPPPVASYRVRGRLADASTTAFTRAQSGARALGAVSHRWLRSQSDSATSAYDVIASGAESMAPAFDDPGAPADGSKRFYKLEARADGSDTVTSAPVPGWRLAFRDVSAGGNHTCALSTDGHLWCWGARNRGQLGTGVDAAGLGVPVRVGTDTHLAVAAGFEHTCVVRQAGAVVCWGSNDAGESGVVGVATVTQPNTLTSLSGALDLAAGRGFSCAVARDRTVRCWGRNGVGQLGNGTLSNSATPTTVTLQISPSVAYVSNMRGVSAPASGSHACAFSPESSFCWGNHDAGQVGAGQGSSVHAYAQRLRDLDAFGAGMALGARHTCSFGAGGALACWGFNGSGQAGQPTQTQNVWAPTTVDFSEGEVWTLAAGGDHTCVTAGVAASRASLYCWGSNGKGQLGVRGAAGGPTPVAVPLAGVISAISAGDAHTCAVVDGDLWCWGQNGSGQAGGPVGGTQSVPARLTLP